jgi:site-specific DNA-methyltransferase (adenine-specific)
MSGVSDESIHLVVTSPPYFDLVDYSDEPGQLGHLHEYDQFLDQLDHVWRECYRVLIPGGNLCCVVGDVCRARRKHGRHEVIPLHADLSVRFREHGFLGLATVLWSKIANATTEVGGVGAALGKPYEPNGVIKNDVEFILRVKKPGPYRSPTPLQRAASLIPPDDYSAAMRQIWADIPGASRKSGHPAPFPVTLAQRLIRIGSFVEDTILDPFAGTGTTAEAAMLSDRNSISYEVSPTYVGLMKKRFAKPTFFASVQFESVELGSNGESR